MRSLKLLRSANVRDRCALTNKKQKFIFTHILIYLRLKLENNKTQEYNKNRIKEQVIEIPKCTLRMMYESPMKNFP